VRRGNLAAAGVAVALATVYGGPLVEHMARAADPGSFNDDARQQIVPFFTYSDGIPPDFASTYYLTCMPAGYHALYRAGALVADPAALGKVLPYALLVALLAAVAAAAHRIGGGVAAGATIGVVLTTDVFLERMVGGLPRAFGYPLVALAAAALAAGRLRALAAVVVLAVAFYPPVAVPIALALAAVLLVLPRGDRGQGAGWSPGRRIAFLGGTAALAVAVHLPAAVPCAAYGAVIPSTAVAEYPEVGPRGRYVREDRAPFPGFAALALRHARRTLGGGRGPAVAGALAALAAAGTLALAPGRASARRLLALALGAVGGYAIAVPLAPRLFVPDRYGAYPVPVLLALLLPAAVVALATALVRLAAGRHPHPALGQAAAVAACVGLLLVLGGRVSPTAGYAVRADPDTPLIASVRVLPAGAIVAGWPAGPLEDVPYLARRRVFLAFETHQAFHRGYLEEMRRRTRALVDAYFATTWTPVLALREAFGVTHLLVDRRHFQGRPPSYFAPYDRWIAEARARGRDAPPVLLDPPAEAIVFQDRDLLLLDLGRLAPG
jgi:hypothetical protein